MKAAQTVRTKNSRPPSFETVWASLQELAESQKDTDRRMKETDRRMKETDRRMKETSESQKETDRQMKETDRQIKELFKEIREIQRETSESQKETARQIKETDRQIQNYNKRFGEFSNRFGEVVEYMIAPNLRDKFRELGFDFPSAASNRDVSDYENNIFLEIDVILENGGKAMLVEVKTKLTTGDVKEHIKRLDKMRKYADLRGDKRSFLGAVAGVVMTPYVKKYALGQGLFVIEPSGETFNITPPDNKPKEW